MKKFERQSVDLQPYIDRTKNGPCFICETVKGNPEYRHHIVYEDDTFIAFLNKYPTLYGYTLVAPKEHIKQHVIMDYTIDEYLAFQRLIYRIGKALHRAVPTERLYILTLGSQQGNSHVHWHIAPLPPGVPYYEQQYEALRMENGVLKISDEEMASLAMRIRQEIEAIGIV